jgi:hypothetical protein
LLPTQGAGGKQLRISASVARPIFNLHRRPHKGFTTTIYYKCLSPRRSKSHSGNHALTPGDEGPGRIFHLFIGVLSAEVEDWFAIVNHYKVLHVICTPPLTRVNSTNVLDEGLRIGGKASTRDSGIKIGT